ncbi:uncharacterized protein LOC127723917 [Mytilus californianus]|uniref:uncharacterized protein LOC127723917 n=1 Tax=Mytilus californianus TaxID=6549 RepID=UPI0022486B4A|nr:uncharacterized protein LOC127723917 [Mytilus californianus]
MVDTASALDRFLNWIVSTQNLPNFDYAILFSGYNLTYGGSASNTGLSYPSSVCQNISLMATTMGGPVAVVEESFSDIRSIGIAAQELGRSLGARKDFDGNNCFPFELNIMTSKFTFPSKSKAPNLWKFSSCSIDYFEKYITDLLNMYALQGSDFGSVCYGAYCYVPQSQICSLMLPGDGTLCSNKSICFEGRCSFAERANETLGCEYGDRWSLCNASLCATYDNYTRDVRCCRKCSIKPYSKSSILTSTATEPTTEMEVTSVTFGTPDSEMFTDRITTDTTELNTCCKVAYI